MGSVEPTPPQDQRHLLWHWLRDAWGNCHRYQWRDNAWWRHSEGDRIKPFEMAKAGWRYERPDDRPQEPRGG